MDTIYALASAQGRAGIAVVRVSGPDALVSLKSMTDVICPPRKAMFAKLHDPQTNALVDEAVIVYFQGPNSYTGEDTIEYHIHGGKAVRDSLFSVLASLPGYRLAEAGEFTRRGFENGKMDLTQAEAVADLIHAETEAQKQLALSQMGGALANLYQGWADRLIKALAYAEAQIDFSEEDLPEEEVQSHVMPVLNGIEAAIDQHLNDGHKGEILRDGIKIAVIGAPNAGKSSLINALAKRDVAIVSEMAGTTRDVLEVHLDIKGYPITLYDTAGLRPEQLNDLKAHDQIEAEGIKRALQKAKEADFKILLFDGTDKELHPQTLALADERSFIVINKKDHVNFNLPRCQGEMISISTKNSDGLDDLIINVSRETSDFFDSLTHSPSLTRARHREALIDVLDYIMRAKHSLSVDRQAEDIRMAVRAIGKITGRTDVEDLLDIIFRDFCIGK